MRLVSIIATVTLVLLTACGPTDFAERTETVERTLTVREIDHEARRFAVTGVGQRFVLRVSEAVVNFDQIEVGDKLSIEYVESVAVAMATPEDTGETVVLEGAVAAPEGAKPGIAGGEVISAVVEFVAYDSNRHIATVRTASGNLLSSKVQPAMRRFAAARVLGDRIAIEIATGLAVAITPAP
jgi:hypothetical protein